MPIPRIILNVGDKYYDWEVIEMFDYTEKGKTLCQCRCKCGFLAIQHTAKLKKGFTHSCRKCAGKIKSELLRKLYSGEYILVKKEAHNF